MRVSVPFVALALFVAVAGCSESGGDPQQNASLREALDASNVSLRESVEITEGSVVDSKALRATILTKSKVLAVDALADGALSQVRIDPQSGDVVSTESLSGPVEDCPNAVSLTAAIDAAEAAVGGEAVVIAPDDDGDCNREVKVLDADDVLWEVKVNQSGDVIETEVADDAAETDD